MISVVSVTVCFTERDYVCGSLVSCFVGECQISTSVFASNDGALVLSPLSMFLVSDMNECFRKLLITSDDDSSVVGEKMTIVAISFRLFPFLNCVQ